MDKLRLEGISRRIGGTDILKDINFSIREREIKIILGASGSGKTTILNVIAGIATPDSGKVIKDGSDITALEVSKRNIGFVFQDLGLFYSLNVAENIAYGLRIKKVGLNDINEKVREISKLFSIEEHLEKSPSQLSGGEKQLVALARTLINGPDLLLMDEPLSSLDSFLRNNIRWYIKDIPERFGVSIIYVTHDLADAEILGDSIAILDEGTILGDGQKEEILTHPKSEKISRILGYNIFGKNGRMYAIHPSKIVSGGSVSIKIIHEEKGIRYSYLVDTEFGRLYFTSETRLSNENRISLDNGIKIE